MLLLKLEEERLFLKVLEAILDLVDVANVHCSSTGLKLQAMDTEHVAVITLFFHANNFDNYQCDKEFDMGIPIDSMVMAFRCAAKDDTITNKRRITLRITIFRLRTPKTSASKCPLRGLFVAAITSATSATKVKSRCLGWS